MKSTEKSVMDMFVTESSKFPNENRYWCESSAFF